MDIWSAFVKWYCSVSVVSWFPCYKANRCGQNWCASGSNVYTGCSKMSVFQVVRCFPNLCLCSEMTVRLLIRRWILQRGDHAFVLIQKRSSSSGAGTVLYCTFMLPNSIMMRPTSWTWRVHVHLGEWNIIKIERGDLGFACFEYPIQWCAYCSRTG